MLIDVCGVIMLVRGTGIIRNVGPTLSINYGVLVMRCLSSQQRSRDLETFIELFRTSRAFIGILAMHVLSERV